MKKSFESPRIEVIELELEQAVLLEGSSADVTIDTAGSDDQTSAW